MSRKTRRKIKRKTKERKKGKSKYKKSYIYKHLDAPITNRFTRITTYAILILELVWIPWFILEFIWFYLSLKGRM